MTSTATNAKIRSTQHTPAPWRYEAGTKTIRSVPTNYWLATLDSWDGAVRPHHDANARLMAAAPELLAALQNLFEQCVMTHKHWGEGCNTRETDAAIEACRNAITKATGDA